MQRRSFLILGLLFAVLVGLEVVSAAPPVPEGNAPLAARVGKKYDMTPETVERLLKTLGEEANKDLQAGQTVVLPGLGTLRVVRIAEYKDLKDGRPVTIPAHNTIEFLPEQSLVEAGNKSDVKPAVTVPAFEFNPLPDAQPGQKSRGARSQGIRTRP